VPLQLQLSLFVLRGLENCGGVIDPVKIDLGVVAELYTDCCGVLEGVEGNRLHQNGEAGGAFTRVGCVEKEGGGGGGDEKGWGRGGAAV
jgi:hypothetical protein